MAEYVALIDVVPEKKDVNFDKLVKKLAAVLPDECRIEHHEIMPVAFGLKKARLRVRYPEDWGGTDKLEELFGKVDGLQGIDAIAFSKS
jgi:translation elongation factor aEF-1 beta